MICVNALAYREKNLLLDRFVCGLRVGTRGSESMSKGTGKSREPNGRAGYKALLRGTSDRARQGSKSTCRPASQPTRDAGRGAREAVRQGSRLLVLSALCPVFAGGAGVGPVQSQLVQPGERRTGDGFLLGQ